MIGASITTRPPIFDEAVNAIQLHHAPRAYADRFYCARAKKVEGLGRSDAAKHYSHFID